MAFVVETGTGDANANSYVSVAEATDYHADRGNTAWAEEDNNAKQAALVRATDYIEQQYGASWKGCRLTDTQALAWPRTIAVGIPKALKQAVCQLALEAIEGTDLNPTQGRAIKREKVGPIETEYMDNARPGDARPAIDGLLLSTGFLNGTGAYGVPSNGKVVRV